MGGIVLWSKTLSGVSMLCAWVHACVEKLILSIHSLILVTVEYAGTGDTQDDRRRATYEPS